VCPNLVQSDPDRLAGSALVALLLLLPISLLEPASHEATDSGNLFMFDVSTTTLHRRFGLSAWCVGIRGAAIGLAGELVDQVDGFIRATPGEGET
jgi:hypothetical protein